MSLRPQIGDVLEIRVPAGFFYVHYLGKHMRLGACIAVAPVIFTDRIVPDAKIFMDSYATFYPVGAAVSRKLATIVGRFPSPGLPSRFRVPGFVSGAKVMNWIIDDGNQRTPKRQLTAEERLLPIAEIWNQELLIERVTQSWRPEQEV